VLERAAIFGQRQRHHPQVAPQLLVRVNQAAPIVGHRRAYHFFVGFQPVRRELKRFPVRGARSQHQLFVVGELLRVLLHGHQPAVLLERNEHDVSVLLESPGRQQHCAAVMRKRGSHNLLVRA